MRSNAACCPHCREKELRKYLEGPPEVLRCDACSLLFLSDFPTDEDRASYYQEEYYEEDSGQRFLKPFETLIRFFRQARMRDIRRRLPPVQEKGQDAFLDVGCGRGLLLDCFKKEGWKVVGTQLSETAKRACEERYGVEVLTGELPALGLTPRSFRAIALYHVLEHLDCPLQYLTEAHALLRSDGLLVVEVPDANGPGFRFLGVRNFCLDYPHHLYFFTPRSLKKMLEQAGFRIAGVRRFSWEYSPFTTLQNILNLLPGEPNRLYRSLMRNVDGQRLRKQPLTWLHLVLGLSLAGPALLLSLSSLALPAGNTMRFYCYRAATALAPKTVAPSATVLDSAARSVQRS